MLRTWVLTTLVGVATALSGVAGGGAYATTTPDAAAFPVDGGRETLEADPLVSTLDAVRDGRSFVLEGNVELAFGWSTILSIPYALDAIVPMLEDAVGSL